MLYYYSADSDHGSGHGAPCRGHVQLHDLFTESGRDRREARELDAGLTKTLTLIPARLTLSSSPTIQTPISTFLSSLCSGPAPVICNLGTPEFVYEFMKHMNSYMKNHMNSYVT